MKSLVRFAWVLGLTTTAGCFAAAPADLGPWPKFYGLTGAYGVRTPQELGKMAVNGFHLALINQKLASDDAVTHYRISVIDPAPEKILYRHCRVQLREQGFCSQAAQDAVLNDIGNYLRDHISNPNVIGFWILDDFPGGDIRPLLRKIHQLIVDANAQSPFPRAAICGFNNPSALLNFDRESCDMVALYLYSKHSPQEIAPIDWSLTERLPEMLTGLRVRGWIQARAPLIGMPQTFGNYRGLNFAEPTADDVAMQSEAFCRAGAVALLAFTWHDSSDRPGSRLYNTPSLVDGLRRGMRICKDKYWVAGEPL